MTYTPLTLAPAGDPRNGPDGTPAKLYRFDNGYGVSVTHDPMGRYGWSLAVVRFFDLDGSGFTWQWDESGVLMSLDYSTGITSDIIRIDGPKSEEVDRVIAAVAALDPARRGQDS